MLLQPIRNAHHSTSDKPEETSTSLKEPASKKPAPDLESKAIGPPDSRHKSKGTPQLTTHLSKHLNLSKLGPPKTRCQIRRRRTDGTTAQIKTTRIKTYQNKPLTQHQKHNPEHLINATLRTTEPSIFAEEKNLKSSRDWTHHNCTTLCRPKGRHRPKTDDEVEVGKTHRSLDDQKEGTVTKTSAEKAQAPLHKRNTEQKQKTQTNEQHNNGDQPLTTKLKVHE